MNFLLRVAIESDKEFLLNLRKLTMSEHLANAGIHMTDAQHAERRDYRFENAQIIEMEGESIGLLKYSSDQTTIELSQLQILPDWQGRGIGKTIIDYLITLSLKESRLLTLKVLKENKARHLYHRMGFEIVGEEGEEFKMAYDHRAT